MQRRIIHLDMDAFYAAIEQQDFPELRGKPLIVGGDRQRGVVATASYEARPYGIHSAMPMAQALKRCPHAIVVPPRRERYTEVSRQIFAILRSFTSLVEPLSLDEAFLDVSASEALFGPARDIARQIKVRISAETQLTASAGVAPNKLVAKIASDIQKPDGLVEVQADAVLTFLHPLPVTRLWGVGPVTARTLHDLGIQTIGDLATFPRETLISHFGAHGEQLWQLAHGIDDRPVEPDRALKSLGEEETFAVDLTRDTDVHAALLRQAQAVAQRLCARGLAGRTVTVKVKLAERLGEGRFRTYTRSYTLPSPTADAREIYRVAGVLYAAVPRQGRKVRLTGISLSTLTGGRTDLQLSLFPHPYPHGEKRHQLGQLLDQLTLRYGEGVVHFGAGEAPPSSPHRTVGAFPLEEEQDPLTAEKKSR